MKRVIRASVELAPEQQVNRIGKYLYKHIDGSYKIEFSTQMCDVYFRLYYQISGDAESFKEMHININITTYQKKIRVNVIRMDELEKTLGSMVYKPEQMMDLPAAKELIYTDVCKKVQKEYEAFDFVF